MTLRNVFSLCNACPRSVGPTRKLQAMDFEVLRQFCGRDILEVFRDLPSKRAGLVNYDALPIFVTTACFFGSYSDNRQH